MAWLDHCAVVLNVLASAIKATIASMYLSFRAVCQSLCLSHSEYSMQCDLPHGSCIFLTTFNV